MPTARPQPSARRADHDEALEQRILSVERELEHTQRLATVGTIAAGIAHEVNNLLTPPLAYAQLAQGRPDDDALARKAIAACVAGIEDCMRILGAVLDLSSPHNEDARADVADALAGALDCLGRDLSRDRIALECRMLPGVIAAISPLALQQVLLNLLLNATAALRGRPGSIVVTAAVAEPGRVLVTVADDGPGIPPDLASRVFEPFVSRAPAADGEAAQPGDRRGGTGLGLAICKRTIESAGGRITASETPGGGATFTIELESAMQMQSHPETHARKRQDAA
jgi:signal transduction histidine kinase